MQVAERQGLIAKAVPLLQEKQPHFPQRLAIGHRLALVLAGADQHEIF